MTKTVVNGWAIPVSAGKSAHICIRRFLSSCGRVREVAAGGRNGALRFSQRWDARPGDLGWWTGNDGLSHRTYSMRKGRTIMQDQDKPAGLVRAAAGIDAAITARHHIAFREFFDDGTEHLSRFTLTRHWPGWTVCPSGWPPFRPLTAVVEPTSMTWLALTLAVERAGGEMEMIGARHSSRLRGAVMGKNKSDVIDSEVLTHAGEIFDPPRLVLAGPGQLALRRAVVRRAGAVIDGNRYWRRLLSLARWAFPDVWTAFAGSESTALAVLAAGPTFARWAPRAPPR